MLGYVLCNNIAQVIINQDVVSNAILIPEEDINTASFEFSPVFYNSYIAYVNDRGKSVRYDSIKKTPYFDLSFAAANVEGNLAKQASFVPSLSSENQEGPFCFTPDQNIIYFTRTDPTTGLLRIHYADWKESGWNSTKQVSLLSDLHHECHPSISVSGNFLVFAASGPGENEMDLYLSQKENDEWALPIRLVSANSEFNDWFPRFVGDSIIIFSSNRPASFSGLNMYGIKWEGNEWTAPELLPSPLNSNADDFGLVIGDGIAYFSSNRSGVKGKDDLFRIEYKGELIYDPSIALVDVELNIRNKLTLDGIPDVRLKAIPVVISDDEDDPVFFNIDLAAQPFEDDALVLKLRPTESLPTIELISNSEGKINMTLTKNQKYAFAISAAGYNDYAVLYSFSNYGDNITYVLEPKPEEEFNYEKPLTSVIIPTKAGSVIIFDNLYYDFNSHIISEGAASELDALAVTMKQNPKMTVRLSAHTDSRGTKIYNQRLSEKRALSAKNYLINSGINGNRIEAVGFGELRLRNKCADNIPCSEAEHRFNRRTEVTIVSN